MFKKRLVALVTGIALIAGVASAALTTTDWFDLSVEPAAQAIACNASGGSGGGC